MSILGLVAAMLAILLHTHTTDGRGLTLARAWSAPGRTRWLLVGLVVLAAFLVVAAQIAAGVLRLTVYAAYGAMVACLAVAWRLGLLLGCDVPAPALPTLPRI